MRNKLSMVSCVCLLILSCSGNADKDVDTKAQPDANLDLSAADSDAAELPDTANDLGTTDVTESDQETDSTGVPGGAVAFVSSSDDDLIGGPAAAGVLGDVVMRNDLVRFVIRNQKHSLYSPYGGALVDADLVRPEGEPGQDKFLEMFPMIGMARIFYPKKMEILDDGAKSGQAVVRFSGADGGMALVDAVLPTAPTGLEVTVDYILAPGAQYLEIITRLHNPKESVIKVDVGQFLQFSSRTTPFFDDCGENQDCLLSSKSVGWLASKGDKVSYGVTIAKGKNISLMISFDKLTLLSGGQFSIQPDGDALSRQYFVVGNGTIEDIRDKAKAIRSVEQGEEVKVQLSLADAFSDMGDVSIKVRKNGADDGYGWVTETTPDQDGLAGLYLEPGLYDFHVTLPGADESVAEAVEIKAAETNTVSLSANAAGWLRVQVKDKNGNPLTAAVTLQAGADSPWTRGTARYLIVREGETAFPVAAGDYTLTAGRGLVWSIDRKNVTLVAGQMTDVSATIDEAVDTSGFVMMNTHEHTENSIDSAIWVEDRVYNALANGIEVMTPTDHDFFGTRQPVIESLGLEDEIISTLGCEVSPLWGHTTAAHCSNPPAYPTYFAIQYMLYDEDGKSIRPTTATEIYEQARNDFGCFFLAVNHPYRGGATFSTYDLTATSDPADAEPDLNLHLVNALEVYNKDDSLDSIITENLPAWFNLLNRGYTIAAIGGSDEHNYRGNYGNPRNMVMSSTDIPGDVVLDEVYQSIKDFRSMVVGGPVIRLTVDGKPMGSTVSAAGSSVEVRVVIEAPEWMGLEFARVVVNGETFKELVPVATGVVGRLDETFTLDLTTDAWIVVYSGSSLAEHEMVPVAGKQPFSVTNPIFIDSNNDGYTAIHTAGAPWDVQ